MTIAYWCVLIMILLPYIFTVIAKWSKHFDNHDPRAFLENNTGWRRRAHYVQLNSFESFPAFGIAVVIAHLAHAQQHRIDLLAMVYVACRILYGICYVTDKATFRSLFWFAALVCVISLFVVSA
jgi:uncharacterized MAPEG superfamily protein